jgi:tetratricopeptide (TPR) repeat protein
MSNQQFPSGSDQQPFTTHSGNYGAPMGPNSEAVADIFKQRSQNQASSDAKMNLALIIFLVFAGAAAFLLYQSMSTTSQGADAAQPLIASGGQSSASAAAPDGGSPGAAGGAAVPMDMLPPQQRLEMEIARVEELFFQNKLTEARGAAAKLDANHPKVEELKIAIQAMSDANDFYIAKKVLMAWRAISRIEGTYAQTPPVARAREIIETQKDEMAEDFIRQAQAHFRDGRYEAAKRQFEEALLLSPAHKEAQKMIESSRLAEIGKDTLDRLYPMLKQDEYARAERLADEARGVFENCKDQGALRMMSDTKREIDDCYYYARMMSLYHEAGDARGALEMFANLSPVFIQNNELEGRARTIKEVGESAERARAERSADKAMRVLALEVNPHNVFRREMENLLKELKGLESARARSLSDAGLEAKRRGQFKEALAMFLEARKVAPEDRQIKDAHQSLANEIIVMVHRLEVDDPDNLPERARLLQIVVDYSFESDTTYTQASNRLKRVQDDMKRAERERR